MSERVSQSVMPALHHSYKHSVIHPNHHPFMHVSSSFSHLLLSDEDSSTPTSIQAEVTMLVVAVLTLPLLATSHSAAAAWWAAAPGAES